MITGMGMALFDVSDNAKRNSFQLKAMQMIQVATIPGTTSGSATREKAVKREAPSTSAASSSSMGNSRNIWLRMITGNGSVNVALSITSAQTESSNCLLYTSDAADDRRGGVVGGGGGGG